MTYAIQPACLSSMKTGKGCKHFRGVSDEYGPICDAFPEGIPGNIFFEGGQHEEPYPGDQGIRYEEWKE